MSHHRIPTRAQRGLTLVELVVVGAVAALLLAVGVTNLRQAVAREQVDGWARAVANELSAAQQAAITRRTSVIATFQDQTFVIAAGGTVLRQETLPSHITFGSTLQSVQFDRRGLPIATLVLTITSTSGRTYTITVQSGTGRVTLSES
jgi:type II secretory pathway pseudopilin PulG